MGLPIQDQTKDVKLNLKLAPSEVVEQTPSSLPKVAKPAFRIKVKSPSLGLTNEKMGTSM